MATDPPSPWHLGGVAHRALALLPLALSLLGCAGRPERAEPEPTRVHERIISDAGAARLDELLARDWQQAEVTPSPEVDDAEFLRRVTLDLVGRIPTRDEVDHFLASRETDKRAQLVDRLLASEAFAEHWARQWTDLLLPGDQKSEKLAREPLERHLAASLAAGRGWDRVVADLLASEGELAERPELAYLAARGRGADKPERLAELASTSSRVFLGSRIECAQCHDHPYASDFSQDDFWSTVALFGRMQIAIERKEKPPTVRVSERSRGELRLALGMAGANADEVDPRKRPIAPSFLGEPIADAQDQSRREQLAALIVDDPRFAAATVGLIWTRLFGRGIVEPWDDLLGRDPSSYPPALALLGEQLRAADFDLRLVIRTIVLSEAYQRSSTPADAGTDTKVAEARRVAAETHFARASVRGLSAEQLFESLRVATGLDEVEDRAFAKAVQQRERQAMREYAFVFGDDEMAGSDAFTGSVPQALLLLNGGVTNQAVRRRPGSKVDELLALDDVEAAIEALWRSTYARDPSLEERAWARGALGPDVDDPAAWEDLLFAMLQSTEFTSNH